MSGNPDGPEAMAERVFPLQMTVTRHFPIRALRTAICERLRRPREYCGARVCDSQQRPGAPRSSSSPRRCGSQTRALGVLLELRLRHTVIDVVSERPDEASLRIRSFVAQW